VGFGSFFFFLSRSFLNAWRGSFFLILFEVVRDGGDVFINAREFLTPSLLFPRGFTARDGLLGFLADEVRAREEDLGDGCEVLALEDERAELAVRDFVFPDEGNKEVPDALDEREDFFFEFLLCHGGAFFRMSLSGCVLDWGALRFFCRVAMSALLMLERDPLPRLSPGGRGCQSRYGHTNARVAPDYSLGQGIYRQGLAAISLDSRS